MLRRRISIVACLGLAIVELRSTDSLLIPSSFTAGSSTSHQYILSRIQRLCNDDNISLLSSSCHNNNNYYHYDHNSNQFPSIVGRGLILS